MEVIKEIKKKAPAKEQYTFEINEKYTQEAKEKECKIKNWIRSYYFQEHRPLSLEIKLLENKSLLTPFNVNVHHNQPFSCGAGFLTGISCIDWKTSGITPESVRKELIRKVVEALVAKIKEDMAFTYVLCSNNDRTPIINSVLEELAIVKTPKYLPNPNMDNTSSIKIWVL